MARLALGTAQLGQEYGIANRTGRPSEAVARAILDAAYECGIRDVDTAQAYGDSESLLGAWLAGRDDVRVVTKLAPGVDARSQVAVRAAAEASAGRLGRAPDALLLHDPAALAQWDDGVGETLATVVADGLAGAAGVSTYEPAELERALELDGIAVVQVPFSALDRRLRDLLPVQAKEIVLRSVFLQGLLVTDETPAGFEFAAPALAAWRALCREHGVDPAAAALGYAAAAVPGASILVGCESPEQVRANAAAAGAPISAELVAAIDALPPPPAALIDPRGWPR